MPRQVHLFYLIILLNAPGLQGTSNALSMLRFMLLYVITLLTTSG